MSFELRMLKEPKYQISDGYWDTSGRGIDMLVAVMDMAGVVDFEYEGPEIGDFATETADMDDDYARALYHCLNTGCDLADLNPPPTEAQLAAMRAEMSRLNAWREARSPHAGLVSAYKFATNDGCHILPEECALIADALDTLLEPPPEDLAESIDWDGYEDSLIEWIEDWRDFNRVAATHGGYRVS